MLICDAGDDVYGAPGHRGRPGTLEHRLAVRASTGPPGTGDDHLHRGELRLARCRDGDTLICRHGVAPCAERRWPKPSSRSGTERHGDLAGRRTGRVAPRAAALTSDGRLVAVGRRSSSRSCARHESSATATSVPLDCGIPAWTRRSCSLTWRRRYRRAGTRVARWSTGSATASRRRCRLRNGVRRYDFPAGTPASDDRLPRDPEHHRPLGHAHARGHHHPVDEGQDRRWRRRRWRRQAGRQRQLRPEWRLHVSVDGGRRHGLVRHRHRLGQLRTGGTGSGSYGTGRAAPAPGPAPARRRRLRRRAGTVARGAAMRRPSRATRCRARRA